jgi:hypothetical protein
LDCRSTGSKQTALQKLTPTHFFLLPAGRALDGFDSLHFSAYHTASAKIKMLAGASIYIFTFSLFDSYRFPLPLPSGSFLLRTGRLADFPPLMPPVVVPAPFPDFPLALPTFPERPAFPDFLSLAFRRPFTGESSSARSDALVSFDMA